MLLGGGMTIAVPVAAIIDCAVPMLKLRENAVMLVAPASTTGMTVTEETV